MNDFLATPRTLDELASDDHGQVVVEYTLLTATIILPMGAMAPGFIYMLFHYFYRIIGVVCSPFS